MVQPISRSVHVPELITEIKEARINFCAFVIEQEIIPFASCHRACTRRFDYRDNYRFPFGAEYWQLIAKRLFFCTIAVQRIMLLLKINASITLTTSKLYTLSGRESILKIAIPICALESIIIK